jgi:hypothetical protein
MIVEIYTVKLPKSTIAAATGNLKMSTGAREKGTTVCFSLFAGFGWGGRFREKLPWADRVRR